MQTLFDFKAADISAGVIGGLITALILASPTLYRRGKLSLGLLNSRWALKLNQAEHDRILLFSQDRMALQQYLFQQLLWGVSLIGVAMMFVPLAVMQDKLALPIIQLVWLFIGAAIYMVTLLALGMLQRVRSPKKVSNDYGRVLKS